MTTKKTVTKVSTKKRSKSSCPVLQKIQSHSPEEKNRIRSLKNKLRKDKRERARLRKAECLKRAEEEVALSSYSSDGEAAVVVMATIKREKQRPPPPKKPVQSLPYLHKPHSFDRDKIPENLKEKFRYTGQV